MAARCRERECQCRQLNFSDNFEAALLLWPLLSFVLTLPILAYLYHRDGRLRFGSIVATYLAVLYLLGLGCFTLYPLPQGESGPGITYGIAPNFNPLNFMNDIAKEGLRAVLQLAFNIAFFMPLGFIAGRLLRMRFFTTLLLSLATSMAIEFAQLTGLFGLYDYAYRCCDVDDVITNTLGGVLGWLCARALGVVMPGKMEEAALCEHPGLVRRAVALWLDLLLVNIVSVAPWATASLVCELIWNRAFVLPDMSATETVNWCYLVSGLVALVIVEVIIPWFRDGSTPGGSFVRMTFETHPRTVGYRLLFYMARSIVLGMLLVFPVLVAPVLVVFYLILRKMPYDYVP